MFLLWVPIRPGPIGAGKFAPWFDSRLNWYYTLNVNAITNKLFLKNFCMKSIIHIVLAFIFAGLTFVFLVKKMKDDCIP